MAEQSNITLRFDAEDGGAEKGLLKLEQAERKLEAAVKSGNRTLMVRANTEEQLTRGLDKIEARERAAAAAALKRAAAMDQGNKLTSLGVAGIGKMAAGLASMAAGAISASAAISLVREENARLIALADKSNAAVKGLQGFIALQAPGAEGQAHVRDTALKGARSGLTTEQTGTIATAIQSIADADGNRKMEGKEKVAFDKSLSAALLLGKLGVSAEDTQAAITGGMVRGISGDVAADKLVEAAGRSKLNESDFARSSAAMGQFGDQDAALAAVAAMSRTEDKGELPTLIRSAALALGESADSSEFSKKYGLAGLSEAEKIARLREIGKQQGTGATEEERIASFSKSLKEKGLDETKARAVGALIREGGTFADTYGAVKAIGPGAGVAAGRLAGLEADPAYRAAQQAQEAKTMAEAAALFGPESDKARALKNDRLARGAKLQAEGGGAGVNPETGEAYSFFEAPIKWIRARGEVKRGQIERGEMSQRGGALDDFSSAGDPSAALDRLTTALEKNNALLDRNNAVTEQANTAGGSAASKPVGGAASNAEEKY